MTSLYTGEVMMLTTHVHLLPRLRMNRTIPPVVRLNSWCVQGNIVLPISNPILNKFWNCILSQVHDDISCVEKILQYSTWVGNTDCRTDTINSLSQIQPPILSTYKQTYKFTSNSLQIFKWKPCCFGLLRSE